MTEKELKDFLISHYPVEDEKCDWKEMKNLKNSFNGHEGEDVMSYVSGIANMEGGVLVIGVKDKTLEIVSDVLSAEQKKNKITNLLSYLRIHNVIMVNENKKWVLVK